jgi:hypothetical protein
MDPARPPQASGPERCEFGFIADPEVRAALQRYYKSSRNTFNAVCYPWTVLLAGRAIETILLDVLKGERTGALLIPSNGLMTNRTLFPKDGVDLGKSDSIDLISVAVDRGLVSRDATRLFDPAHECGNRAALSMEEWKEVAEIALEVLVTLDRKLSDAGLSAEE